ncbi:MAG: DUF4861 family protein [Luteolibacter sp.]
MKFKTIARAAFVAFPSFCTAAPLAIEAINPLPLARTSQTIELSAKDLAPLGAKDLNLVHIKDSAGKEVLCQAIDNDGDELRQFDAVIFQSDFAPGEHKTFSASVGGKQVFSKEQYKAFGRFVRERFDDFTWENDRIAHRTYGKALETWKGEPLTSSTIDIWSKRTPRMVINDWYLADDYHVDHGEGADYFSAGKSRGCGGNGVWSDGKLWVSNNFTDSRVLANGPIRVMFELDYAPYPVGDGSVNETKRITLDAGQQLDHFQSFYKSSSGKLPVACAIGLKKTAGEKVEVNAEKGWLVKWEKMEKNAGNQGLAVITDPKAFEEQTADDLNQLVVEKLGADNSASYWAGFCWDKYGGLTTSVAWKTYVDEFTQALAAPIQVTVTPAE